MIEWIPMTVSPVERALSNDVVKMTNSEDHVQRAQEHSVSDQELHCLQIKYV